MFESASWLSPLCASDMYRPPAVVELFDSPDICSDRISVLHPDNCDSPIPFVQCKDVGGCQSQADAIGRDFLGQAMDGVALSNRLPLCVVVPFRCQRALVNVDD